MHGETMTHDVALRDAELAALISRAESEASELLIVANTHTVRAAKRADTSSPWADIGRGDFDAACAEATRSLAKKGRLFWHTVQTSPSDVDLSVVPTIAANRDLVTQWVKTASQVSKPKNGGRGANPSPKDIDDYGNDAAWRCQFSGCGLNLLHHKATGSTNKSSYFAHIVASSKDGPRGGDRSHELSADINNFILLCDDCHRLIDRRDPDRYTEAILLRMRAESLAEVRRLLDTLAYPAADIIVLMGCISTQAPHYIHSLAEPAMWLRKTRATPGHPRHYFANDWTLHSPHNKEYWSSFFRKAGSQLSEIRSVLAPANRADEQKRLAVFPLHGTSVLVLAGRIFGEAAAVDVLTPTEN